MGNQHADNMFEKQAALDFRCAAYDLPYASGVLAVNTCSMAGPPNPEPKVNLEMFPQMPPMYRYPGELPPEMMQGIAGWGPLGLAVENAKLRGANEFNRPPNMIVGLQYYGAAERAGARIGDVIVEVNRMPMERDPNLMQHASKAFEAGQPVALTVVRANERTNLCLTPLAVKNRPKGLPGHMAGPNWP